MIMKIFWNRALRESFCVRAHI